MNKFLITILSILIVAIPLIIFLPHKFASGSCIADNDNYIWHINNYRLGKYYAMGWQGKAWGNEISSSKEVMQRKSLDGIIVYHEVVCPEFNPN
jgi:hypothetical protein